MIKLRILVSALLLLNFLLVQANPVSETEALQKAQHFHQQRQPSRLRSSTDMKLAYTCTGNSNSLRSTASDPAFYIYNIGQEEGFILISGEDATKTVLAYSDNGSFNSTDMPENLKAWLEFYRLEIEGLRSSENAVSAVQAQSSQTVATTTVGPLLGSIKWNQSEPYNLLCPYDQTEKTHAVTGCVATAMAQVMKYYEYPASGTGTHSYIENNYGTLSVNLGTTTYDWNNMLGSYANGSTPKQDSAVAKLIYHCGVTVNMDYSTSTSSAYVDDAAEAFVNHFGYDSEIQMYQRTYYTTKEWNDLIKRELNASRPVYFSARTETGGHAFICDGYDSNDLFHINWGWGGYSNGFFELSSLDYSNPGLIGTTGGYCLQQRFLGNIKKSDGINKTSYQLGVNKFGMASSVSSVATISTGSMELTYGLTNAGLNDYSGKYGVGYIKGGTNTLVVLKYSSTSSALPSSNTYTNARTFSNISTSGFTAGTYQLFPIYMPADSTSWSIIRGAVNLNSSMMLVSNGSSATIQPTFTAPNLQMTKAIQIGSALYQNKTTTFDITIQNTGMEYKSYIGLYLYSATDTSVHDVIAYSGVNCPSGETMTYHFSGKSSRPPGDYLLKVLYDRTNTYSKLYYTEVGPGSLNTVPVKILNTPGVPVLLLNNPISLPNGNAITRNENITLSASITNNGGFFDSTLIAFVFPKTGGYSLTSFTPQQIFIDSLETKTITLTGSIDLDPGEYFLRVYYLYNHTWVKPTPNDFGALNFTVSEGVSIPQTSTPNDDLYIHRVGDQLTFETTEAIHQIELVDVSGRLIRQEGASKTLYVGDLRPGLYLIRLNLNGKIVVQRYLNY